MSQSHLHDFLKAEEECYKEVETMKEQTPRLTSSRNLTIVSHIISEIILLNYAIQTKKNLRNATKSR